MSPTGELAAWTDHEPPQHVHQERYGDKDYEYLYWSHEHIMHHPIAARISITTAHSAGGPRRSLGTFGGWNVPLSFLGRPVKYEQFDVLLSGVLGGSHSLAGVPGGYNVGDLSSQVGE